MQQQFVIYSGSFAKDAKMEKLNVKTFSSAVADIPQIGVLKNFAKLDRETLVLKSPFKFKAYNFIKKRLQHMCFPAQVFSCKFYAIFLNTYSVEHL